ncbi:MAG: hypothetical protein ABIR24_00125 [Verrucomicrobiota bacterium]
MKPDYETQLEKAITDKLKALPELSAPDQLAARVMSTLATRAARPWYRNSWQTLPPAAKTISFLLFLVAFGGLCFAGWKFTEGNTLAKIIPNTSEWFSTLNVIGNTTSALFHAALLALKQLSPVFLFACALIAVASYTACIGLGTVIFRYTKKSNL